MLANKYKSHDSIKESLFIIPNITDSVKDCEFVGEQKIHMASRCHPTHCQLLRRNVLLK